MPLSSQTNIVYDAYAFWNLMFDLAWEDHRRFLHFPNLLVKLQLLLPVLSYVLWRYMILWIFSPIFGVIANIFLQIVESCCVRFH